MSHSSSVLDSMRVPGTGIFFLGCFESRVTVLSQQRRALNLVDAIIAEGKTVRSHGRVAVVGGGAAGLTAAAAFAVAAPALRVDLFERQGTLMYLQRSSDRDLHPHIYDWPMSRPKRTPDCPCWIGGPDPPGRSPHKSPVPSIRSRVSSATGSRSTRSVSSPQLIRSIAIPGAC